MSDGAFYFKQGVDKECGDGCGGDVPLAIIAESYNVHALREDGILLEER
jgi:hypothetical protein